MSTRDVLVRFRATVDGFTTPVDRARASVEQLHESTRKTQSWKALSTTALAAGAAITVGLGFAVKAAMDWETAWTGVRKTVDASEAEFAVLEGQLKELVRTLPASATEIAAVAENAGQLGIKAGDIARFTKTMIELGVSTNLTSEQASTAIAQIANVMGTSGADIERFGAALVALGNNGASTERDILEMAQRIAAAGKLVGLGETDVLAYASALSSVGIEAEAGGSAISMAFQKIANVVDKGGEKLRTVAKVAGVSADTFRQAWETDAAGAMASFITGLDGVEKAGGSASRVLDNLGLNGIRQKNALLSLATSGDLLTRSLSLGSQAWNQNNALQAEAARRFETTASKLQIAQNTATQAAASIGEDLLPVLAGLAETTAGVTKAFTDLPDPIKAVIGYGAAFAGTGLLAVGAAMKLASGFGELRANVATLAEAFPKMSAKMGAINWGKVAAGASVAAAALAGVLAFAKALGEAGEKATLSAEGVADGLSSLGRSGVELAPVQLQVDKLNEGLARVGSVGFGSVSEFIAKAAKDTKDWQSQTDLAIVGFLGIKDSIALTAGEADKLDQGLAGLAANGNVTAAQDAFRVLSQEAYRGGATVEEVTALFDSYATTLQQVAGQLGVTSLSTEELAAWMGGALPQRVREAAAAHPELVSQLSETEQGMVGVRTAAQQVSTALQEQAENTRSLAKAQIQADGSIASFYQTLAETRGALDDVEVSVNKSRTALNLHTEAGRHNQGILSQLAMNTLNTATAMEKSGKSTAQVSKIMTESRAGFIEAAKRMGLTGKAAAALADEYGLIPEAVTTDVSEKGADDARGSVSELYTAVDKLPAETRVKILSILNKSGITAAWNALEKLDGQVATTYIRTRSVKGEGADTHGTLRRSEGGWVFGPGTWTSDSIAAALSRDEFVVRAARATAIERAYPGLLNYLNNPSAPLGRLGLAGGGSPTPASYAPAERYTSGAAGTPVVVQAGDTLSVGSLSWAPDTAEELRVFREFMEMASRKVAAGLTGRRS